MKKFLLLTSLIFRISTFAQFHLASFSNDVSRSLSQVIEDFPNHFNSIRGEVIGNDIQSTNYSCTINIAGADSSIIIKTGNDKYNIFSWKEVVFEAEDFNAAKSIFNDYFNKIKGTPETITNIKKSFEASYDAPND